MKRARGGIEDLSLCGGGGELDGVDEVGGGGEEGAAALGVDRGGDEGFAVELEPELLREPRHDAQVLHLAAATDVEGFRGLAARGAFLSLAFNPSLDRSAFSGSSMTGEGTEGAVAVGGREAAAAVVGGGGERGRGGLCRTIGGISWGKATGLLGLASSG